MSTATKQAFRHIGEEYGTARSATATAPRSYAPPAPPSQPDAPASGWGAPAGSSGAAGPSGAAGTGTWTPRPWTPEPGGPSGPPPGGGGFGGGGWGGGGGGGWGFGGQPVATVPFSAARAYDKLLTLVAIAVVCGAIGWIFVPSGLAFVCMLVAFGLALTSWVRVRWAKVTAPAYAVFEGLALGSISSVYSTLGHGIIPLAIGFTGAVFVACLALYRTGLVRVTPRMMALAMVGGFGIIVVSLLSLVGLSLPGLNSFGPLGIIFGVVILAVAVLNLFTDFEFVNQAERLGLPADAEWASAFAMMTALVLVYIAILRIIASFYGGRRS